MPMIGGVWRPGGSYMYGIPAGAQPDQRVAILPPVPPPPKFILVPGYLPGGGGIGFDGGPSPLVVGIDRPTIAKVIGYPCGNLGGGR